MTIDKILLEYMFSLNKLKARKIRVWHDKERYSINDKVKIIQSIDNEIRPIVADMIDYLKEYKREYQFYLDRGLGKWILIYGEWSINYRVGKQLMLRHEKEYFKRRK